MLLPKFEHRRCQTLREASSIILENNGNAILYAGGTELVPRMKYGLVTCRELVSLKGIAPRPPEMTGRGELVLDALMTLAAIVRSREVLRHSPLLAEAAWTVASNQIRNSATLGGNLCQETRCLYYNQTHAYQFVEPCFKRGGNHCYLVPKGKKCWAVFMSDLATALITLKAEVELVTAQGSRRTTLAEIYTGDSLKPLSLKPGEIIDRIIIPAAPEGSGWAFTKFSLRGGVEFAAFNLAATVAVEARSMTCGRARLTCGAVGGGPLQLGETGELTAGKTLSPELFRKAAIKAASLVGPYPHHGYSAAYLKEVLKQETERTLALAADRAVPAGKNK